MPNFLADESYLQGLPNFSITVTGDSNPNTKTPTLNDWMFGNPIEEQLTSGGSAIESGVVVQNKDWNYWTNAQGALRTLNKTLDDAANVAAANKNWMTGALVFCGVVLGAKFIFGGKRR